MAENTKIQWTDHTFNPWWGCTKIAPGCQECYAAAFSKRTGRAKWGPQGTRVKTSESYWRQPLKWNREAQCNCGASGAGPAECNFCQGGCKRPRVFCASMADVFEQWDGPIIDHNGVQLCKCGFCGDRHPSPVKRELRKPGEDYPLLCQCGAVGISPLTMDDVRADLFRLIDATPNLDWLLLTKRPENIKRMWTPVPWTTEASFCQKPRPNVWLGCSVATQEDADRNIPLLLECRDLAPVLFLSAEPLLAPINFRTGIYAMPDGTHRGTTLEGIGLLICGGESGPKARPCRPEWIRSIVEQCKSADTPCFVKQMGANIVTRNDAIDDVFNDSYHGWPDPDVEHHIHGFREDYQGADCLIRLRDKKGGDPQEWPESLRVRQMPTEATQ